MEGRVSVTCQGGCCMNFSVVWMSKALGSVVFYRVHWVRVLLSHGIHVPTPRAIWFSHLWPSRGRVRKAMLEHLDQGLRAICLSQSPDWHPVVELGWRWHCPLVTGRQEGPGWLFLSEVTALTAVLSCWVSPCCSFLLKPGYARLSGGHRYPSVWAVSWGIGLAPPGLPCCPLSAPPATACWVIFLTGRKSTVVCLFSFKNRFLNMWATVVRVWSLVPGAGSSTSNHRHGLGSSGRWRWQCWKYWCEKAM